MSRELLERIRDELSDRTGLGFEGILAEIEDALADGITAEFAAHQSPVKFAAERHYATPNVIEVAK